MQEYELYNRILSSNFLATNSKQMIEEKCDGKQTASICERGVDEYKLYRFDEEERDFLPFFNKPKKGNVDYDTPKFLRSFCDYIILAEIEGKCFVILIEMKSGTSKNAEKQLNASALFMEYIKRSAERISKVNDYEQVDTRSIQLRKVLLKPGKHRVTTQPSKYLKIDVNEIINISSNSFPIRHVCIPK